MGLIKPLMDNTENSPRSFIFVLDTFPQIYICVSKMESHCAYCFALFFINNNNIVISMLRTSVNIFTVFFDSSISSVQSLSRV